MTDTTPTPAKTRRIETGIVAKQGLAAKVWHVVTDWTSLETGRLHSHRETFDTAAEATNWLAHC